MPRLSTYVSLRQVATNTSMFCTHETCVTVSMASVVHLPTSDDMVSHHFHSMSQNFFEKSPPGTGTGIFILNGPRASHAVHSFSWHVHISIYPSHYHLRLYTHPH